MTMLIVTVRSPEGEEIQVSAADLARPEDLPENVEWESAYEGWEVVCDGFPLAKLQDEAWERVKYIREQKLQLAPTDFGTAQSDVASMVKISGLVQMAIIAKGAAQPFSEVFTMADNSEVTLDADQMIGFGIEVGTHIAAVHSRGRELRAAIYAEDMTADDLAAIDLEAGWP
jgi:hypothetical protein